MTLISSTIPEDPVTHLLILALLVSCQTPAERCAGNIEVYCDADGTCTCGMGEFEGEECLDIPNSTDPDSCEMLCCGEGAGIDGPPSILRGTR